MPSTKDDPILDAGDTILDTDDPAASLEIVEKIEKRGGFRPNSSFMHKEKKARKYNCDWCGIEFASTHVRNTKRFCSDAHRWKEYNLARSFAAKKRLTDKARKSGSFRPPSRDASALLLKARKGK